MFNIIVVVFFKFNEFLSGGESNRDFMALPWRYRGGSPVVVSVHIRCISDDPLGVSGDRGLDVAQKNSSLWHHLNL